MKGGDRRKEGRKEETQRCNNTNDALLQQPNVALKGEAFDKNRKIIEK